MTAIDPDRHGSKTDAGCAEPAHAGAETWRARLRQHPADWQAAMALKAEMARCGRYAESDPLFRAARRAFPDDVWTAHMASLYAYPTAELPALTLRARTLAGAQPGRPEHARLLGDLLRQARDYAGAALAYAGDPSPEAEALGQAARHYDALRRQVADAPDSGLAPAIAVINLDRNADRLRDIDAQFRACRPPRFRVPAIEGGRLAAAAIRRLGGDPELRGTLGCFLSHTAAWEAMLARDLPYCLVIEDDVVPLLDLPRRWGVFGLPDGFDVCFVNDRMAPPRAGASQPAGTSPPAGAPQPVGAPPAAVAAGFATVPLVHAMQDFPDWRNAAGADGYLLSAAGARKLLDRVTQDGFGGDVDWRLLAYGLTQAQCEALPAASHARSALRHLRPMLQPAETLAAHVLVPPLIRTVPIASDREDENRAGARRSQSQGQSTI